MPLGLCLVYKPRVKIGAKSADSCDNVGEQSSMAVVVVKVKFQLLSILRMVSGTARDVLFRGTLLGFGRVVDGYLGAAI